MDPSWGWAVVVTSFNGSFKDHSVAAERATLVDAALCKK
jgi:hypothetical protein